jgi:hypothetical protein
MGAAHEHRVAAMYDREAQAESQRQADREVLRRLALRDAARLSRKAARSASVTVRVRWTHAEGMILSGPWGECDPMTDGQAERFLQRLCEMRPAAIILGPDYSLGPYREATGAEYAAILDSRGVVCGRARTTAELVWSFVGRVQ